MKPETSYPFVVEWFKRAAGDAKAQGRKDSAQLWRDGLDHLEDMREQRDELLAALKEIADGCVAYRPGHVNYSDNRTKEEIRVIADAAISKATS